MISKFTDDIQISQHTLRISNAELSLPFYQDKLGMTLLAQRTIGDDSHYFLGFVAPGEKLTASDSDPARWQSRSFLELVHSEAGPELDVKTQPDSGEGYWKIAISISELDIAHDRLIANGVEVDTPRQVGDIAYLCHFNDPDGYCIELIQHDFLQNHEPVAEDFAYALGSRPTFSLITYRVKDAEASLRFYTEELGLRLLSVQAVQARRFTLYFLACTDEVPPHADLEHVDNREWLWQRPYSMVELQHVWGTEESEDFSYRVGPGTGFVGISFATQNIQRFSGAEATQVDPVLEASTFTVFDPDGYAITLIDKSNVK